MIKDWDGGAGEGPKCQSDVNERRDNSISGAGSQLYGEGPEAVTVGRNLPPPVHFNRAIRAQSFTPATALRGEIKPRVRLPEFSIEKKPAHVL